MCLFTIFFPLFLFLNSLTIYSNVVIINRLNYSNIKIYQLVIFHSLINKQIIYTVF